jgi:fluoroacetyl-CoA thioesterase
VHLNKPNPYREGILTMTEPETEQWSTRTSRVVRAEDCATRWGNAGLEVLSTPAILGTMEQVCVDLAAAFLEDGEMTVGTRVEMTHEAATREGAEVMYDVTLTRAGRRIEVGFTVTDTDGTVVSRGRHQRAVILTQRFLDHLPAPTTTGHHRLALSGPKET